MAKSNYAGKSPPLMISIMLLLGLLMATVGQTGLSLSLSLSLTNLVIYSPKQIVYGIKIIFHFQVKWNINFEVYIRFHRFNGIYVATSFNISK
jgi:hypothetical protein